MSSLIFYDLEEIRSDEVLTVRTAAADPYQEIMLASTVWPEDIDEPPQLADHRDPDFLDLLMIWLDFVIADSGPAKAAARSPEQELLETARYGLLFEFARPIHRWLSLARLARQRNDRSLLWIGHRTDADHAEELRDLLAAFPELKPRRLELRGTNVGDQVRRGLRRLRNRIWLATKNWQERERRILPTSEGSAEAPEVVFTEYFPNSVRASLPVCQALREAGRRVVWLPARDSVAQRLRQLGTRATALSFPRRSRSDRWGKSARLRALERLDQLADCPLGKTADSPWRQLRTPLRRRAERLLTTAGRWLAAYRQAWQRLDPRWVLSTSYSSIPGRAAALTAQRGGRQAAYLQHGAFPGKLVYSFFCHDLILVWGEHERRSLQSFGVPAERLEAIGSTLYDQALRAREQPSKSSFPGRSETVRIAFMASRSGGVASSLAVSRRTLGIVAEAARSIPNCRLAVKAHPADSTLLPEEVLSKFAATDLIRGGSSQEVIRDSDLVIVVSSTTGYEACVFGKPLIVLNLTGSEDIVDYVGYGAALRCNDQGELIAAVERLRDEPSLHEDLQRGRQALLDDLLNGGRGDAAELAARVLLKRLVSEDGIPAHPSAQT